jgi:hypothetical protein
MPWPQLTICILPTTAVLRSPELHVSQRIPCASMFLGVLQLHSSKIIRKRSIDTEDLNKTFGPSSSEWNDQTSFNVGMVALLKY